MVNEPPLDGQYPITTAGQHYDGPSSSQQQLTLYDYGLCDPQFFPRPTNESNTQLSGVVTIPGTYNASSSFGQNHLQIAGEVSPDYQRIRSNNALQHISQILMEDVDERISLHEEEAAIQAAEKAFYDILGQPSLNWPSVHNNNEGGGPYEGSNNYHKRPRRTCSTSDISKHSMLQSLPNPMSPYSYGRSLFLTYQPLTSIGRASKFGFPVLQIRRGAEDAKGFDKMVIYLDSNKLSISILTTKTKVVEKSKYPIFEITDHRNNPYIQDLGAGEGRRSKHYTITCEISRNEKYDRFLLCHGMQSFSETTSLRDMVAKEASKSSPKGQSKGPSQQKLQGKRQLKKELVDLRTLLIHCAQAVAADDRLLASELIKKLRQHSSPDGDSTQRMAFYLVGGLEARLAGIGSQLYHKIMVKRVSEEDVLKVYNLYLAACPFHRTSYTFANRTILEASKGQSRVHIVDFGVCYGFQWPSLIQMFAEQGVHPRLRITAIEVPRQGIGPLENIEHAGKQLADYAHMYNVPFQYQGISTRYENIQIEDLNIEEDEFVIINCIYQMKILGDETIAMNSARDKVLRIMRRMNPKILIFGAVNASYSSPFFITRFKELMFHYSSLFDMLDTNVPRGNEARKLLERGLLGRDALNVIACEGAERIERPETYKQWQVRCIKAGFEQLPVSPAIVNTVLSMKKKIYHEDFVADEDSGWLLQGWKGRVITMENSEYCEINSNMTLDYINRLLMEDDTDEKTSEYQLHDTLQATEKPFYDILGQEYPSSTKGAVIRRESQVDCPECNYSEWACSSFDSDILGTQGTHRVANDWASERDQLSLQFERGAEEANKLVPSIELVVDLEDSNGLSDSNQIREATIGQKNKHVSKIRSHPHVDLELLEARNIKHLAISTSETIRDEMFDSVLLSDLQLHSDAAHLREMKAKKASNSPQNAQRKGYGQGQVKSRGKKKEEIDLMSLLIQCAQAIAHNNFPFASELLKKIRYHASPYGDGSQRLALYFANGLEARLAGTGSQMYQKLIEKQTRATDMLKAYWLFIAVCPFTRVAYYFSNQTIADHLDRKPKVHIIDFGITFGFQWPSLIQRFAKREGGPPKLRITGIGVPQPGFHPSAMLEATGKRLAEYAEMFNVPFQYQGVTSQWENICIENLNIDNDEVLIINCIHRTQYLGDETENIDSARDRVLRIMNKINPEVIILGVENGLYSSPFFLPRFREVLFHYSSLFDMLNATALQSQEGRIQIERDLLGAAVLNVVACEGAERIERPESYKQWQVRSLKAGFKQRPVNRAILKRSIDEKNKHYHEDFIIDEDSSWLLQGWKGRIVYAVSSWSPK
ncbi:hypothetical protein U9M48_041539 [Paspalum notatum var. saurae]|uniref:Scarecrow-like protein 9 n=1 Tax=Paspalum notatum var. saurae TaxID=547442 RepID=A0AAQ3UT19_PASNO